MGNGGKAKWRKRKTKDQNGGRDKCWIREKKWTEKDRRRLVGKRAVGRGAIFSIRPYGKIQSTTHSAQDALLAHHFLLSRYAPIDANRLYLQNNSNNQ